MSGDKTLLIIRHGKSSWDYPAVADIDRPLKDRGINDSYEIANRLLNRKLKADALISSPAVRALHTAIIFARVLDFPPDEIIINQDLYLADTSDILALIKETDNSRNIVMIFGHNPGFTELTNYLSGSDIENVPTAGVAILNFKTGKWKDIGKDCLASSHFEFPHKG